MTIDTRIIVSLLTACLLAACGEKRAETAPARPVRSLLVAAAPDGSATTFTAEIHSRYESDLSFQVGGKLIVRAVDVGTMVRKGALLAQLDQTDQRVSVDAARAAVNAARAELARMRSDEERYRDLLERGLTTRATHLAQQTAVKTGQSKLEQSLAELRLNEQKLAYTTLRATADGVVTAVNAEVGAVVSAGQRVVTIAQPSELEAAFDVPDSRIDEIRAAGAAQVALLASPQALYPARIREISPSADPTTRTYRVKAALPLPPAGLRLGMTVAVTLSNPTSKPAIALPATALFQNKRDSAVWVVKKDQTLELRTVNVARYESDRVFIAQGLQIGERVVTAGVHRLAAGERVRPLAGVAR